MYGQPTYVAPSGMPLAGGGFAAMAYQQTQIPAFLYFAVILLTIWTLFMFTLAIKGLLPKQER